MTGKSNSVWTIVILLVVGIGFLVVRLNLNLEAGDSDYRLTYTADFHVRKPDGRTIMPDARLLAAFPETTRYCQVLEPKIEAPEMEQVRTRVHTAAARKDIVLRTTRAGQLECSISFRLQLDRKGDWWRNTPEATLTPKERTSYLANAKGMTATSTTAQEMVNRLRDNHPGTQELVDRIFQEVVRDIEPAGEMGLDRGDEVLLHQKGSPLGRAQAFATLCRAAKIPARLVTGFEIKTEEKSRKREPIRPRTWVEAYVADSKKPAVGHWVPYDPENGSLHELDYNFVPVRRDGVELIRVTNSTDLSYSYWIESVPPATRTVLGILDLRRLPGKLHEPIKVVLILPIGALFTAFVRTIIGIRTFGTFSPTLLALAFVYNDWQSGLCIFFVVIATGFVSRTFLDRLKLLLVPRLGIILTMVVMLMVLSISVMNYFKWAPAGQTVLLPMVILTNLVERFYVTSEEDSIFQAMRLLITTVLLALAIYLLLRWPALGDLLFRNPELHFFTVVALIVMGRYTGYRLTELMRFRDLFQPPENLQG
ncbi:MAG: 7TM domain-containing protein [Thermoguttaceae bacterium]